MYFVTSVSTEQKLQSSFPPSLQLYRMYKVNTAKDLFVNTCTPERWAHMYIFPNNCRNIGLTTFCLGLYL